MDDAWTPRRALAQCGLVPLDAQVLLAHVLGRERGWLAAHATDALARNDVDRFFALAQRRRQGEPVAYLVGTREFWGLSLEVTPAVLIPRPETETLVEAALARLPNGDAARILDLGTGSGAIALALAHARPDARVCAVDASLAALQVARRNAERLGLANVTFAASHWYAGLESSLAPFDMIVANPPYIAAGDPHLAEGDVRHEPREALVAGVDGLADLRAIVGDAPKHLCPRAWLLVEHGYDQGEAVRGIAAAAGFTEVLTLRDLAGIGRVTAGRRRSP